MLFKKFIFSFSLALVFIFLVFAVVFLSLRPAHNELILIQEFELEDLVNTENSFKYNGEKIVYDVRMGNLTLGKSVFSRLPTVELDGKTANLMTFETRLARFSDKERIYSSPVTFLPLKIEREISNWPFLEKISEYYDQDNFTLTIVKEKGGSSDKRRIKKGGPIHNSIILPFMLRDMPDLAVGWTMSVNLPAQEFEVSLSGIETLKLSAGEFEAYRFESRPPKFELWISTDQRRIPLKIKGAGPLGYTLVMREYSLDK